MKFATRGLIDRRNKARSIARGYGLWEHGQAAFAEFVTHPDGDARLAALQALFCMNARLAQTHAFMDAVEAAEVAELRAAD